MASIDVLKRALAANGLPTSGNKDQMLNRLMSGEPDKRKSKQPKASVVDATADDQDGVAFATYALKERAALLMQGFTDETLIQTELKRRWTAMQAMKAKPKPPDKIKSPNKPTSSDPSDDSTVVLDSKLSDETAATGNLVFLNELDDGRFLYFKGKPKSKQQSKQPSPAGKKRAADDEPEPSLDESTFNQTVDIVAMRLLKKAKVANMTALLADYGLPVDEDSMDDKDGQQIARELAMQLCYETDDEADE